jgi:hypothetical protein
MLPQKPHFGAVEETFRIVKDSLSDEVVRATQAVYQFELSGEDYVPLYGDFRKQENIFVGRKPAFGT